MTSLTSGQPAAADLKPASGACLPNNLPRPTSSFIGRAEILSELGRRIGECRVVTLTGVGGCGKTRLAAAFASAQLSEGRFRDGIWWVDLLALADGGLVPQAVAATLRIPERPGEPLTATVRAGVGPRRMLLVLDNCEHVIAECRSMADALVRGCPSLALMATSREALGVAGECVVTVPPMALQRPDGAACDAGDERSEAVQLFVARAQEAYPDFRLSAANSHEVWRVCAGLDGMALAIELAAARVKLLTVGQIAELVADCLQVLTGGPDVGPPHHRTLLAAMDWSHDLLLPSEQALLRRSTVFDGGFDLRGAEAVCAGEGLPRGEVLDAVAGLLDKSMLSLSEREEGGVARYRLLEPIRQYARRHLSAAEEERTKAAHLAYFLAVAEEAGTGLRGSGEADWRRRLEREQGNMRSALRSCREADGFAQQGLRLAVALATFWSANGYCREIRTELQYFLERADEDVDAGLRADALERAALVAAQQGDFPAAKSYSQECVALRRALDDQIGAAHSLGTLANAEVDLGNYDAARALYEEALAIYRANGLERHVALVVVNMGTIALDHGDLDTALELFQEGLAVHRRLGETWYVALCLANLGALYLENGEITPSRSSFEECLQLWQGLGDRRGTHFARIGLASLALEQGDLVAAGAQLAQCNSDLRQLDDKWIQVQAVEANARLAALAGLHETAARLLAATAAERERMSAPASPIERVKCEGAAKLARDALGAVKFTTHWSAGGALSLEQAVDLAVAVPATAGRRETRAPGQAGREDLGGLTKREREVAALLVHGLTNNEIAERIGVAPKTVERHVGNILGKLGFENRAQVAAWAVQKGLAEAPEDLDTLQSRL